MTLSVIIPVFNAAEYLENAVKSLFCCGKRPDELILVDDGSCDGSGEICERLSKTFPEIMVIRLPENRGQGNARNTGLKEASGDYVLFFDADDTAAEGLTAVPGRLAGEKKPDIIVFGLTETRYGKDGRAIYSKTITPAGGYYGESDKITDILIPLEKQTLLGYVWNKFYRRDFLLASGVSFNSERLIEDISFNLGLFPLAASVMTVPEALYRYERRFNSSVTAQFDPDYYPQHRRRVLTLIKTVEKNRPLTPAEETFVSNLIARYMLSSLERDCEKEAEIGFIDRIQRAEKLVSDPETAPLIARIRPQGIKNLPLYAVKSRSAVLMTAVGKALAAIKKTAPSFFEKTV